MITYTVYETTTRNPSKALKVTRPVAHYTDYTQMVNDWSLDLSVGTHTFMKVQENN